MRKHSRCVHYQELHPRKCPSKFSPDILISTFPVRQESIKQHKSPLILNSIIKKKLFYFLIESSGNFSSWCPIWMMWHPFKRAIPGKFDWGDNVYQVSWVLEKFQPWTSLSALQLPAGKLFWVLVKIFRNSFPLTSVRRKHFVVKIKEKEKGDWEEWGKQLHWLAGYRPQPKLCCKILYQRNNTCSLKGSC